MRQEVHAITQDFDQTHGEKAIDTVRFYNDNRPIS
jgi:hypothetical protein